MEQDTRLLLQEVLDDYEAGIFVQAIQLLEVEPPSAVIDAFNDVQRARQDRTRAQNEADAYANRIVPTARGEASRVTEDAHAYKEQIIKEAEGEGQRFTDVYAAYLVAPEVTARRMYLDTSVGHSEQGQQDHHRCQRRGRRRGAVSAAARGQPSDPRQRQPEWSRAMNRIGMITLGIVVVALAITVSSSMFVVHQTKQVLVLQFGEPIRVVAEPGLKFKVPIAQDVVEFDIRVLNIDPPSER